MAKSRLIDDLEEPIAPGLNRQIKQLEARLAAANKLVEQQAERIERLEQKGWTIPKHGKSKRPKRDGFVRVIISDTHGSSIDWKAWRAIVEDIKALQPTEVIHLGDAIDCGGFLAEHHVWGYVAEAAYTFESDVACANQMFDELQAAAPNARIDFLEGNHERRIETWCLTKTLRSGIDAAYLNKMFGIEAQLRLKSRGIAHYKQGVKYEGCRIPATIKRGPCYFTHGSKHGKNAAQAMLARFGANVVFGHVHKLLTASDVTVKESEIAAWCPGGICKQQPLWRHSDPTDWTIGYAVQFVRPNLDFLHINVPVIDNQSFLINLTRA